MPNARQMLPFVFINMAMSSDGKIATANRRFTSIGSAADQKHLLELRATADAVMCGARTVDLNSITMGPGSEKYRRLRKRSGLSEYNLRIIVTGSGTLDPRAKTFRHQFSPIIVLTTERASRRALSALRNVADAVRICGEREIDFDATFRWLRYEWDVKRLLCEGGGELNDALFRANLVNELHLTIGPVIIGGRKAPTISDGTGALRLADATRLKLKSMKCAGPELFLVYSVRGK